MLRGAGLAGGVDFDVEEEALASVEGGKEGVTAGGATDGVGWTREEGNRGWGMS